MPPSAVDYERYVREFRWRVPERYNIGVHVCDRQDADATALIELDAAGAERRWSFGAIGRMAARLSNVLAAQGVARGDRFGVLLSQAVETAVAHVAAFRSGLISLPLFAAFGPDALEYRLRDSGAAALVVDSENLPKILAIRERLPDLRLILVTDMARDMGQGALSWPRALERAADRFAAVDTAPDDPALIIYTSGTTGQPKGALHAHRVLLGHLPGVELPHQMFPQPGDLFWTPADWAWIGGLFDVLMPSWAHGVPVLARRTRKFDPEEAFALMARIGVRNAFLPPTALKLLRQSGLRPQGLTLRSVGSGGESLGEELLDWGRETLGVEINEFYGQTECNLVVCDARPLAPSRPGSMGRAVPGHRVGIVDEDGQELAPGEVGQIAVRRPDPVMFLGYWNRPEATAEKFRGDWMTTGDLGRMDEDGYLRFVGRADDLISSGGYRIGPGEIEECLLKHPAVALAAAIGVPDPLRGEAVKAFLVLRPGSRPTPQLKAEIQEFVRSRLAAHEYPRLIDFVDTLPMTATGKVVRRELRAREAAKPGG